MNMKRSICGWYQILQHKQNIKASYQFSTFIPRGWKEGYSFLSRKALTGFYFVSILDKYNTVHYVAANFSWACWHEFAWFVKLDELYMDREDPWYCHFHGRKWSKMVFKAKHFSKFFFLKYKLMQIWFFQSWF